MPIIHQKTFQEKVNELNTGFGTKYSEPLLLPKKLTDKEIEEYIWEEISIPLNQSDIDNYTEGYVSYLNAVHWAKWGRDNCNGL